MQRSAPARCFCNSREGRRARGGGSRGRRHRHQEPSGPGQRGQAHAVEVEHLAGVGPDRRRPGVAGDAVDARDRAGHERLQLGFEDHPVAIAARQRHPGVPPRIGHGLRREGGWEVRTGLVLADEQGVAVRRERAGDRGDGGEVEGADPEVGDDHRMVLVGGRPRSRSRWRRGFPPGHQRPVDERARMVVDLAAVGFADPAARPVDHVLRTAGVAPDPAARPVARRSMSRGRSRASGSLHGRGIPSSRREHTQPVAGLVAARETEQAVSPSR